MAPCLCFCRFLSCPGRSQELPASASFASASGLSQFQPSRRFGPAFVLDSTATDSPASFPSMPAMRSGRLGFNLLVGGFFSPKRCAEAVPLDVWVPADNVVPACKAVLEAYRDLGNRGNRQKTRMMRLKLPNGAASGRSRFPTSVVAGYGPEGCADVATRQNWQVHGVQLLDVATIVEGLAAVGLTSLEALPALAGSLLPASGDHEEGGESEAKEEEESRGVPASFRSFPGSGQPFVRLHIYLVTWGEAQPRLESTYFTAPPQVALALIVVSKEKCTIRLSSSSCPRELRTPSMAMASNASEIQPQVPPARAWSRSTSRPQPFSSGGHYWNRRRGGGRSCGGTAERGRRIAGWVREWQWQLLREVSLGSTREGGFRWKVGGVWFLEWMLGTCKPQNS